MLNWSLIREHLEAKIPAAKFDAWIRPVQATCQNNTIILTVPSQFFLDGLRERFEEMIRQLLSEHCGEDMELRFSIDENLLARVQTHNLRNHPKKNQIDGYIDPRFTFDNFVVGPSNEFCAAACQAVSERPGTIYNPLYLYGGVGLGKTHLMTAIANHVVKNSNAKIAYRTSEIFTNELVSAIRNGTTQKFRDRYRKVDLLFIDDVQFIAGKTSTQEEFFHTFNALYEINKQIVLTSDKSPREVKYLEERLKSRFNWGLVADIQPPNYETRLAILDHKSEIAGITLPQDVATLLAQRITNNVRELEGGLTRLTAHATLTGQTIDLDFARHVLRDLLCEEQHKVTIEEIQKRISSYYNIRLKEMCSKKRSRNFSLPRQVAMYASKQLTTMSLPVIGEQFDRDHTTVLHAVRKIDRLMQDSSEFREEIQRLLSVLKG